MSHVEQAGVTIRMAELKLRHKQLADLIRETDESPDGIARARDLDAELSRVEADFEVLTRATNISGSEAGRNLAVRKLTLNENFDLVSIFARGRGKKGSGLTQKERKELERLSSELSQTQANLADVSAQLRTAMAQARVDQQRQPGRKRTQKPSRSELIERANQLLIDGCKNS